ncbi:MAG: hypothetical protein K2L22_04830, partial [Muribaculaceae bacterium]|nr:hypothetical protein [Muribaculaceae bacterium]
GVTGRHSNQLNYRTKFPLARVAPGLSFPFADAKLQQIFHSRKFFYIIFSKKFSFPSPSTENGKRRTENEKKLLYLYDS